MRPRPGPLTRPAHAGLADNATSEPYRLYNLDVFEYTADSPFGLYGSIPLLWAQRPGLAVGAFWCADRAAPPVLPPGAALPLQRRRRGCCGRAGRARRGHGDTTTRARPAG